MCIGILETSYASPFVQCDVWQTIMLAWKWLNANISCSLVEANI